MQIKCSYCGGWIDDTLTECPHCGGPNEQVVRTAKDQPLTIEELQEWYNSKGLPPYETTRFFIGENHKGAKAFGIYKEALTGNFVVYKNLASGERKIRYKGKDQAYAVNEIFLRLKEEIIQQKALNVKKNDNSNIDSTPYRSYRIPSGMNNGNNARKVQYPSSYYEARANNPYNKGNSKKRARRGCSIGCGSLIIITLIMIVTAFVDLCTTPIAGYYDIDGGIYYHRDVSNRDGWYAYSQTTDWEEVNLKELYPEIYKSRTNSKAYYISEDYSPSIHSTDIKKSVKYGDLITGKYITTGYYKYDDKVYYHLQSDINSGWYVFSDDDSDDGITSAGNWEKTTFELLPEDMQHSSLVSDFYYTPVWSTETQLSDFKDTSFYEDYQKSNSSSSNSGSGRRSSRWYDDDDDDDYSWSSYDSWDSSSTDWDSDW